MCDEDEFAAAGATPCVRVLVHFDAFYRDRYLRVAARDHVHPSRPPAERWASIDAMGRQRDEKMHQVGLICSTTVAVVFWHYGTSDLVRSSYGIRGTQTHDLAYSLWPGRKKR
jgi:hypothetical protein